MKNLPNKIILLQKDIKPYLKPFAIIFGIYCISMISIWRYGINYLDDAGRVITGKGWTSDFNRYSSSILSFLFIQQNFSLVDISPLSQIIAILLLSVSSLILVHLFGDINKKLHLILSTIVGINPFSLSCWLFKFDSPCMAIALFACIFPFLFYNNRFRFWLCSFLCLIVTLTSYQAFAGVYLVLLLSFIFKAIINKKKIKNPLHTSSLGLLAFGASAVFFKFALPKPVIYRSIDMLEIKSMPTGIINNIKQVFDYLYNYSALNWKLFFTLSILSLLVLSILNSNRGGFRKILNPISSIIFLGISIPTSYGIYLLLEEPQINARSIIGVGCVFCIFCLILLNNTPKKSFWRPLLITPTLFLLLQFICFNFSLGNALKEQYEYSDFRYSTIAQDLMSIYSKDELKDMTIYPSGNIGYTDSVIHTIGLYPLTSEIINEFQLVKLGKVWGISRLRFSYGLEYNHADAYYNIYSCDDNPKIVTDSGLHTITEDGSNICIEAK